MAERPYVWLTSLVESLPRRTSDDLDALTAAQGASDRIRFTELRADFWPEEETTDEFLAWLRENRADRQGHRELPD